jgi:hypothetical protein
MGPSSDCRPTGAQVDRLSGTAHCAADSAADATPSAAEWASGIPEQRKKYRRPVDPSTHVAARNRLLPCQHGVDTRTIQAYLGHRNIMHTVRYTQLAPDRFRALWRD